MRILKVLSITCFLTIYLSGCASTHKTGTDTRPHIYPDFTVNGDISIINSQEKEFLTIDLDGPNHTINLISIVNNAKLKIENQIAKSKSTDNQYPEKTIELSISSVHVSGIFKVTIYMRVDLGNGITRGVEAKGESWLINQAIDNATFNIPEEVLNTARIIEYIEE